jgi:aspartate/methionine/tyrosine aminotransferase
MDIPPFATEQYFGLYEHAAPHTLSASDAESMTVGELCAAAGLAPEELASVWLGYPEPAGHPELRRAIAAALAGVSADDVLVLAAPEEGIYLSMRALLAPGDRVVVLTPCYDSLANLAEHIGCRVARWELVKSARSWELDLSALDRLLAARPKLVVVNFPHNPTGYLPDAETFRALCARVEASSARMFCDEMYRGLELTGVERLASACQLSEQAIALSGLSKVHGLPGLRIGWLLVRDAKLRARLLNWKHYTSICAPAPTQYLASAALSIGELLAARSRRIIEENLQLADAFFARRSDRLRWRPPRAGSVALCETDIADTTLVCHRLAERAGLLLLPGACLGAPKNSVRIGLGRRSFSAALALWEDQMVAKVF